MTRYEYGFFTKCAEHGLSAGESVELMRKSAGKISPKMLDALHTVNSKLVSINGMAPTASDLARFAKEQEAASGLLKGFINTNKKALSRKGGLGYLLKHPRRWLKDRSGLYPRRMITRVLADGGQFSDDVMERVGRHKFGQV